MTEAGINIAVRDWLADASRLLLSASSTPRLDAELLLAARLKIDRASIPTLLQEGLLPADREWLDRAVAKRLDRTPMAYILGYKDFLDFRLSVTPDVLIPRPETEAIVRTALDAVIPDLIRDPAPKGPLRENKNQQNFPAVYEIGTGSGAIGIGLARALPQVQIVASDISEAALDIARKNANDLGVSSQIEFIQADLGSHIEHAQLLVANLPYLPADLIVAKELEMEPQIALWSGADGLDHYRRLFTETSFDVAVIELGADQYSTFATWIQDTQQDKSIRPIKDIDGKIVGMILN